ncbi:diguanylate phosphodiesterase [Thermocrinis albus DSM 14484]|uniref:Diguanylate phosphodiesterase n=1 Tax=Thermocrinis albus (strain DSM 14484 / JCM 11386 / HI 11/12) TaxID=638303 RepID=D3SQ33_THEAH|nr:HDOD domain-containing protein [Thermocrinis albus]ADC89270.1 diguanylate phosphodiesterase [Thermocrinis albus DSM 14484]
MHVVCKQAIYDRDGKVAFYEIFVQDRLTGQYPENLDPLKATGMAVDVLVQMGPQRVGNGHLVFVNVPAIFLSAEMFDLLPPEYVGIELVENKRLSNELLASINTLLKRGFKFCIDDFGFEKIDYLPLLNKCQFVKIDFRNNPYDDEELKEVVSILKSLKKGIIAKNIQTKEDYERAYSIGFQYFQGFYLSKPVVIRDTRTIAFLKSTLFKLYNAIREKDMKKVVEVLEKDVGATYKLLKFVNSAFFPKARNISKLDEAVVYLGFDNVVKFAIVLALSEMFAPEEDKDLWERAVCRALLTEKLAEIYAPHVKDKAYMAGLFSLSKEIFGEEPEDVARELALDKDIQEAYERKLNEIGFLLSVVELLEDAGNEDTIQKVAKVLRTTPESVRKAMEKAKEEARAIFEGF